MMILRRPPARRSRATSLPGGRRRPAQQFTHRPTGWNGQYCHNRVLLDNYARGARFYDPFLRVATLGLQHRLRRALVRRLDVRPGDFVLDLACGTGLNLPYLQEAVGPSGSVLGVDLSADMLARAAGRRAAHQWTNVSLVRGDLLTFRPPRPADAVLSTFAVGLVPDPEVVVRRMAEMVAPGGRVVVADTRLIARWWAVCVNPLLRLGGRPWIPRPIEEQYWTARPWLALESVAEDFRYEEWIAGAVYVASARSPL